ATEMLECLLEQRWSQLLHAFIPLGRLISVAGLAIVDSLTLELLIGLDLIIYLSCFLLAEFFLMRKLRTLPGT
ncbi:hypothetical protein, partial [Streptobacillus moniliformis]|uniref:hypothetical protein n=1 Tax=Streptobacillus moniliformis TaxID=34105 RepID=UPI001E4D7B1B